MATVNIYLTFNGNCEEAFDFYKSIFGGEYNYIGRFGEMPPMEDMEPISDEDKNRIMHVGLPISNETMLLGCDNMKACEPDITFGSNFSIMVDTQSREEADRLFAGLSEGGEVWSPMKEEFWGDYMGMFVDKFGINWMVGYTIPQ